MADSMRVLVVDDEPLAVERLQLILARMDGVSVVGTANDGEAALRIAEAVEPDVVLLDIAMPGMDGIALARALREAGAWRDLPLIALTGRSDPADIERGRAAGFTDYVAKFDRAALLESLRQCLSAPVVG